MNHRERVDAAFTQQAAAFEDPRLNRPFTTDAEWIFDALERGPADLLLDVAAGTGHAARRLAPDVRTVIALDATAAMLTLGQTKARDAGLANIVFLQGDAAALPFLDGSFDVVVSRYALHHLEDPAGPLAEMGRCLRPGGRLAVADLVAHSDPAVAARQNELETVRDASHARMLTVDELTAALVDAGLASVRVEVRELERPLEPWLEHTAVPPDLAMQIRSRLDDELAGGAVTGFQPRRDGDELRFVQTTAAAVAVAGGDGTG